MELNTEISVDCVVFGYDSERLNVLLVERKLDHLQELGVASDWTLTGNHIYQNETLDDAAKRVLFDLTGLKNVYLEQFRAFAHPERLLRKRDQVWLKSIGLNPAHRVVTVGFIALLETQKVTLQWMGRNVKWFPLDQVEELAFDHNEILQKARIALRQRMKHEPIALELLPQKFTLSQLQQVYEQILGAPLDKRNFRKKVNRMKYVIALDERQQNVPHKPAQYYRFDREIYEQTRSELFDFVI